MNATGTGRKTIGFLTQMSTGAGGFHDILWRSMVEAARERDVNLLVLAGGSLDTAPYDSRMKLMNVIYELIEKDRFDGLIVNHTIGNYVTRERFVGFLTGFSPLPVIDIIGILKGFPDVHVDNASSMRDMLLHMIEHHGHRKLAFIKGAEGNVDAEERYRVYREVLAEKRIPIDEDLMYSGDFNEPSGARAIEAFTRKKKEYTAVIASNDAMAFGAIRALTAAGKRVPRDIVVTGFDDTDEASASHPTLTTVRQPFKEICLRAIDILFNMMTGARRTDSIAVPAKIITRQSCGCSTIEALQSMIMQAKNLTMNDKDGTVADEQSVIAVMKDVRERTTESDTDPAQFEKLIRDFIDDVQSTKEGVFTERLDDIFHTSIEQGKDVSSWQSIIFTLRKHITNLWNHARTVYKAENMINQACVLIGEASKQVQEYLRIKMKRSMQTLREVGQELTTTFSFDKLKTAITTHLPRLDIPSCFISIFNDMSEKGGKESEVFNAYDKRKGGVIDAQKFDYTRHALPIPDFFPRNERFTFAVHAILFETQRLGYAMFELGPEDGVVYDTLQVQISSSLMGSRLFRQREKTEAILKQRADTIQELVRPMLVSIGQVSSVTREKISVISGLVALTNENNEKLTSTNRAIESINEKISKMTEVIKIINDISAIVNILAINTSIEAAHAGKFGRGFSVIAGEIRKLADSIKKNTTEISDLLSGIQPTMDESRKAGSESMSAFNLLRKDVMEVAETLDEITRSMESLSSNSTQILSLMNAQ